MITQTKAVEVAKCSMVKQQNATKHDIQKGLVKATHVTVIQLDSKKFIELKHSKLKVSHITSYN